MFVQFGGRKADDEFTLHTFTLHTFTLHSFTLHSFTILDYTSLPRRTRKPAVARFPNPCPPCAWQIAHASASAASGLGSPASCRSRRTMCCTCSLRACPLPTTACFTCSAVYSASG